MSSKTVAVIGATGLTGKSISLAVLRLGYKVIAVTRSVSSKEVIAKELENAGAKVVEVSNQKDEAALATAFRENQVDTVICAMHGSAPVIRDVEGRIINAAVKSGTVERFCPDEFGVHTGAIPWGLADLFDAKKEMQELIRKSGLKWTAVFVGGVFPYLAPSLKSGRGFVVTFGDRDALFFTNSLQDIGMMIARAATDERTINKYVQFQVNPTTQAKNLEMVRKIWPKTDFPERHIDEAELIRLMRDESDNDLWVNLYAIFCMGRMDCLDFPETMLGDGIFPADYKFTTIEECLSDSAFVFPDSKKS
ncbi:Leucoanthocyanidin reductase [Perkinsus olseni]|uniref:Leucoanthocyanidin reductase n=1 Tax=Perkinsus olseni TaxID=32597 RepID=A0A7J6RXC8_PEROL|nr:Leucoanthocyanidin reductase [Perkinsus olseni]KAF4725026.1 Leucoanthocyanidin reductase [Perkinsus olseni]